MIQYILDMVSSVSFFITVAGAAIVVYGALHAAIAFIRTEFGRLFGGVTQRQQRQIKQQFGANILLGLEFFIAGDIIKTILSPTLLDLAILGSIVVIRTFISFFLNRELTDAIEQEAQDVEA